MEQVRDSSRMSLYIIKNKSGGMAVIRAAGGIGGGNADASLGEGALAWTIPARLRAVISPFMVQQGAGINTHAP